MEKKQIIVYASYAFIAILVIFLLAQIIIFKNSARYARYELGVAAREHNSSICDKYYNYEQIIDNQIGNHINETAKELDGNPFADLAYAMVGNMRPVLIAQLKSSVKDSFENNNLPKENKLCLMWQSYRNTSGHSFVKVDKINKNKELYTNCPFENNGCMQFTWEKVNNAWQIVEVNQISIQEATK